MSTTDWQLMDALPAAPSGESNVKWQSDAPGTNPRNISAHFPTTGGVDARTTTTETVGQASRGELVTFNNAGAIAVTINSAVNAGYFCFVAAIGAGNATLTPTSGTIRLLNNAPASSAALNSGQWGVLFWDGTNWWLEAGGTGGGGGGGSLNGVSVKTSSYLLTSGDNGKLIIMNSASAQNFTLPASPPSATWVVFLANINTGAVSILRNGLLINNIAANLTPLTQFSGLSIWTDNSNYFTNGVGIGGDLANVNPVSQEVIGILSTLFDTPGVAWADGQIIQFSSASGKLERLVDRPIVVNSFVNGAPTSSQIVVEYVAFGSMTFPANFASPNSYGNCATNPTATATYTVSKISGGTTTTVGTIVISTGGVFSFTTTGGVSFNLAANDLLRVTAPGSPDATLATVAFTLVGTRTATVPAVLGQGIFIWRGAWSSLTAYNTNDVVSYTSGGTTQSYICILGNTGNTPPSSPSDWSLLASAANGTNGSTWYNGSGAPSGGLGVNGDYYLDTTGNVIYYKSAGSWSSIGTISGATVAGVQAESYTYIADTGAANAYVATLSPALGAYAAGVDVAFKAANANTGASTLNVNGLGAKTIKKYSAGVQVDLAANDIVAGQIVRCKYDGTNFQAFLGGGGGGGIPPILGTSNKRWEGIWRSGNSNEKPLNGFDNANSPTWTAATTTVPPYIVNWSGGYVMGQLALLTGKNIDWQLYGFIQSTSSSISWTAGIADNNTSAGSGSATPAGKYALFRYIHGTDTNFQCMTSDGTTQSIVNSGVAVDTATHTFEIVFNDAVPNVVFKIDGTVVATITTHLPGNGVLVRRGWYVSGGSATTAFAEVAFYVQQDPTWP